MSFIPRRKFSALQAARWSKVNSKSRQKSFLELVQKGKWDKASQLVFEGLDPNFITDANQTPLIGAVLHDDKDACGRLLQLGAFPDYRDEVGDTQSHIRRSKTNRWRFRVY